MIPKNIPSYTKNLAKSLVGLFHGIPDACAKKEQAEAAYKWIEFLERYLEFLRRAGFSEGEIRRIIEQHIKYIQEECLSRMAVENMKSQFSLDIKQIVLGCSDETVINCDKKP